MAEPGDLPLARRFLLPGLFIALLFAALIWRRPAPLELTELRGEVFGTTFSVKVVGPVDEAALSGLVEGRLAAIDATMSTWREDSELSRLNRAGEAMEVSPELMEVLRLSEEVWQTSGGALDPTVGPLVDLWGFGPAGREVPSPTEEALEEVVVGWSGIRLGFGAAGEAQRSSAEMGESPGPPGGGPRTYGSGEVVKADPRIRIDLSAVAKGWAADAVAADLVAAGHEDLLVEIGGEVFAAGDKRGEPWVLGIEDPRGGVWTQVALSERGLATSGDYRNVVRGRSHTIDPRTRRPVSHGLASVSVVAESCALADAWATALTVLGPEDGPAMAESAGIEALFLVREGDGFREIETAGFSALPRGRARVKDP